MNKKERLDFNKEIDEIIKEIKVFTFSRRCIFSLSQVEILNIIINILEHEKMPTL
jgi:hypothetical protein